MFVLDLSSNCKIENEMSKLFSKLCYKVRDDFNYLINDLTQGYNSNIDLLVSNPSSRNTLNSNLFEYYCKVQLVRELIREKKVINEIIVDSKALKNVLIQLPGLNNTKFIIKRRSTRNLIQNYLLNIAFPFTTFLTRVFQLLLFKIFFIFYS